MNNIFLLLVGIVIFSGCTIKREVSPISKKIDNKVCIIRDNAVRPGFLVAYRESLEELGYIVKILPENSNNNMCKISSTYTAKWSWDLAIYMSYAKINVYKNSKLIGSALYDSRSGGGRIFDKFGNGNTMIKSLVKDLYPKAKK
jgi:hypothetical protein